MRILFVNEYSTARAVSGAEYSTQALAEALKVEIFSPPWKKNQLGKSLAPFWFNNPIYWFYSGYQIEKEIRAKKIDVIHVHGKYIQPGAVMAGRLTKTPVVTTVRDFKFLCPLALCFLHGRKKCTWGHFLFSEIPEFLSRYSTVSWWGKPWLTVRLLAAKVMQIKMKWFLNKSDQVIAVSPQLKKIYEDAGVRRVVSIYNLPPTRQDRGYSPQKIKTLLSVGKLSYGKGTDSLIEAMKSIPPVKLILAGDINSSLKVKFPKNIQYLGKLSHQETLKLYGKASAFVINSRWPEPLSRAGLEALSYGLPIIASNRGGNQELIKDNGFLVNPDSPREIAKAINEALKQAEALSKNSLKLLTTRFNREKIINKHLELYQSLIK
jgi:glycosyltransferase involved in cell wall biosynthesis